MFITRLQYSSGGLIFSNIYVGSAHFWGFHSFNFNIFGSFQKNKYFWGMKKFWLYIFKGGGGGHRRLFCGIISMHFRIFLKVKVQNGNILGDARISNILVCLIFLLGGYSRCWAQK